MRTTTNKKLYRTISLITDLFQLQLCLYCLKKSRNTFSIEFFKSQVQVLICCALNVPGLPVINLQLWQFLCLCQVNVKTFQTVFFIVTHRQQLQHWLFFFLAHVSVALGLNKLIWSTMVTSLIKCLTACGCGISPPEHLRCFKSFSLHVARCENNNCGWTNVCRNVKVTHTLNMMKWVSLSLFFYSSYFSIPSLSLPASLLLPFLTSIMYSDTPIHCSLFSLCVSIVPRPSLFFHFCPEFKMSSRNLEIDGFFNKSQP